MLKRNIAILIAGGLLSAQAGFAAADTQWIQDPALEKYFAERAARAPTPKNVKIQGFPRVSGNEYDRVPAMEKYLAEREARNPNPTGAAVGSVFDDDCMKNQPG